MLGKTCKGDAESLENKTSSHGRAKSKQTGITFRCYNHGFKTPYQLHTPLIEFHGLHTAHHRVLGPGCYSIEP